MLDPHYGNNHTKLTLKFTKDRFQFSEQSIENKSRFKTPDTKTEKRGGGLKSVSEWSGNKPGWKEQLNY